MRTSFFNFLKIHHKILISEKKSYAKRQISQDFLLNKVKKGPISEFGLISLNLIERENQDEWQGKITMIIFLIH